MLRLSWTDLPERARADVEDGIGAVTHVEDVTGGQNSDVAAVVHAGAGEAFVKAVRGHNIRTRWLRNELAAGGLTGGLAPGVLAHATADDWLVVAFERVGGRSASLAPASPDLGVVAHAALLIGLLPAVDLRPLRDRWAKTDWWDQVAHDAPDIAFEWNTTEMGRLAARLPALADGDRLVHTDLHGDQVLVDDITNRVHVVDWGMPGSGARWVDPAFLVLRLIEAGHTPSAAETWGRAHFPALDDAGPGALDAFAAYLAGMWTCWALGDNPPRGAAHRAQLARRYARYRLTGTDMAKGHAPHLTVVRTV